MSDAISLSVVDKRRKGNDRLSMAALGSHDLTHHIKSKQEEITGKDSGSSRVTKHSPFRFPPPLG